MKKRLMNIAAAVIAAFVITGCSIIKLPFNVNKPTQDSKIPQEQTEEDKKLDEFLDEQFIDTLSQSTVNMHFRLKDPESMGIERPEKGTFGESGYDEQENAEEYLKLKEELDKIDREKLSEESKNDYDFIIKYIDYLIVLNEYPQFSTELDPNYGIAEGVKSVLSSYKFYVERDVLDYFDLIDEAEEVFSCAIEQEKDKEEQYRIADFTAQATIENIDTFLSDEGSELIESFSERLSQCEGLSEDKIKEYAEKNEEAVSSKLLPAYRKLREDILSIGSENGLNKGLIYYDGGEEYYSALLSYMSFSDRTPEEIADKIVDRTTEIAKRSTELFSKYTEQATTSDFNDLTADDILQLLKKSTAKEYPELKDISYTVEEIPSSLRTGNTLAYYTMAPLDDSDINLINYDPAEDDDAEFFITLAHEGYPGHMYQWNYFIENDEPKLFMSIENTGYLEGWAMYTGINSLKYCDFEKAGVPAEYLIELYSLNEEYGYLMSALCDIFVNYYGYTKENLEDFLTERGFEKQAADSLYETVIETPGLYPRYYCSYLELVNIREKAEQSLGNDFDVKEFNTLILDTGICYYSQLEETVDKYIDKKAA